MVGNHTMPSQILSTCTDGMMSCFSQWAYDVTNGFFWVALLLGFVAVLIMGTSRIGFKRSFGFGSFVGMIGSIWFAIMGLMTWWIASLFMLVGMISIAMMIMDTRTSS